jgi:hypothetical protein
MSSQVATYRLTSIAGLGVAVAGCFGPAAVRYEMLPVEGRVTMEGQPLAHAEVMLDSIDGPRGFGVTDDRGMFTVMTRQFGAGLPAGTYRVLIGGSENTRLGGSGGMVQVATTYGEKGVGRVTIGPGSGPLAFDLKKKPDSRGADTDEVGER